MFVQVLTPTMLASGELDFDPFDVTKVWPRSKIPMHEVGELVLNRNPEVSTWFGNTGICEVLRIVDWSRITSEMLSRRRFRLGRLYRVLSSRLIVCCSSALSFIAMRSTIVWAALTSTRSR